MTDMRTNFDETGKLARRRYSTKRSSRESSTNDAALMKMFKKYRIKCPKKNDEKCDADNNDNNNSATCVRQKYCNEYKDEFDKDELPKELNLMRYPVTKKDGSGLLRAPCYCSVDDRKSSSICRKLKHRSEKMGITAVDGNPYGSADMNFGGVGKLKTSRKRTIFGKASRSIYNPID